MGFHLAGLTPSTRAGSALVLSLNPNPACEVIGTHGSVPERGHGKPSPGQMDLVYDSELPNDIVAAQAGQPSEW